MAKVKCLLLCFYLFSMNVAGQQLQGANWFFGGFSNYNRNTPGNHLDFRAAAPVLNPYFYDFASSSGVATISDKHGQLLFFSTNGRVVTRATVNNRYQEMPNGNVFGTNSSGTFSEMIVQVPDDEHKYYIFFITNSNELEYHDLCVATVDMRLNNGLGDIVPNSLKRIRKNIAPGLAAMLHANNRDVWIVTQKNSGDSIHANLVTPAGIAAPIASTTNYVHPGRMPWPSEVRIKGSPNSELIVGSDYYQKNVKIYAFNRAAGTIALQHNMILPNNYSYGSTYSFSADNSKLYVITSNGGLIWQSYLYQYNLKAGTTHQIQQSGNAIPVPINQSLITDLQLGIDGKIYISRSDSIPYLSRLNCPDLVGAAAGFELRAVKLYAPGTVTGMLPSLNQTIFRNAGTLQAQAQKDTICWGDSVQLLAYGAGTSRFKWQIANGLSSSSDTLANPFVRPITTTTYTVTGSGACQTTLTAAVTVVVRPKPVALKVQGLNLAFPFSQDQVYEISDPVVGSVYNWQISGGEISAGQGSSKITVNWFGAPEGKLEVTETGLGNCIGEKTSFLVKIDEKLKPVFYNIITLNQDQKNEVFEIGNLKLFPENELVIYNRWGVEVYRKRDYQNNWPAENVSSGIYYYYFKTNGKSWKGWLEVVK